MRLPGGLVENGARRRDWAFRPLSGALELALAEVADEGETMPRAVTRALALALDSLAGGPATPERVAALCVADRQFLMRELERHLGVQGGWSQARCRPCGARFDFHLDYADLPVQEAGEGYPLARVDMNGRPLHFRLPSGADQEILATLPEGEANDWLLGRLASEPEALAGPDPERLAAVEAALEAMAPGIVLRVAAQCPECGADNEVDLDPYRALSRGSEGLLEEVHQIASHYHWSEADILGLPRRRRRHYLDMIGHSRGMAG